MGFPTLQETPIDQVEESLLFTIVYEFTFHVQLVNL